MKKMLAFAAAALLLAAPAMALETPEGAPVYNCDFQPACEVAPGIYGAMGSPVKSKFNLTIGGYIKLDYVYNSSKLNSALLPGAPGGSLPAVGTTAAKQDENLFTARQSRLWFKVNGPTLLGAKTGSLIEFDFYGQAGAHPAQSNELALMRLRLAYATLDWTNTQVLFGQSYDIFGPGLLNTIDLRQGGTSGAPANPRVPQIRVTQKVNFDSSNALQLTVGVQNPVQDFAPTNTAADGAMPNVAGQIMFVSKALGVSPGFYGLSMNSLKAGFFGLLGTEKIQGQSTNVDVWGYGFYGFVPVLKSKDGKNRAMTLSFDTELWMSAGLDMQGANAPITAGSTPPGTTAGAALIGSPGFRTAAKGWGGFAQLIFYPTQDMGISGGYARRNAYDYAAIRRSAPAAFGNGAFEQYNEMYYGNVAYDLNAAVRVAVEYEHGKTQFSANPTGATGNFGQINVARLAAYYFF
jgi:hypothetical protein